MKRVAEWIASKALDLAYLERFVFTGIGFQLIHREVGKPATHDTDVALCASVAYLFGNRDRLAVGANTRRG